MKFDHDKFVAECGGAHLNPPQKAGLLALITAMETDEHITDVRWMAYMFATVQRECGGTWQPIEEEGKGKGKPYGKPDKHTGLVYYGRGYTQNTWYDNYKKLTDAWNRQHPKAPIDFTLHPELFLIPEYAYWAMSYAMRTDLYTGVGLDEFIKGDKCDYVHARKVINGMDHAVEIAKAAAWFEQVLKQCQE